jgi:glycosyltransferase involved in cell wall biosynthesis
LKVKNKEYLIILPFMHLIIFTHPTFIGSQSMPRYAAWLAKGMQERGHTVQIWSPKAVFFKLPVPSSLKKWMGYIDQYIIFPLWVKKQRRRQAKDTLYVFSDHALGPWVSFVEDCPHIIHCHDFLAQRSALGEIAENPTSRSGKLYQSFIRKGYRKGKNFISISNNTQVDLHRFLGFKPLLSAVIYNGLNQDFEPMYDIAKRREEFSNVLGIDLNNGFVLHVGGNQWYKNRLGVLALYNEWRKSSTSIIPLLMVGKKPSNKLKEYKENCQSNADIHFLRGISDEMVRGLYATATVFVFPSLAEGFGWPIAEAMASGCPVITTNEAPMSEVGGQAAFYINRMPQFAIDTWAKSNATSIEQVIGMTDSEREKVIQLSLENSARFDSNVALDKIAQVYKQVLIAKQ